MAVSKASSPPSRRGIGRTAEVSRRTWVTGMAFVASLGTIWTAAAEDAKKASKKDVSYQDQPKGKEAMCAQCKYFQPPNACMVVEGTISPAGWCQRFEKKEKS